MSVLLLPPAANAACCCCCTVRLWHLVGLEWEGWGVLADHTWKS